MTQTEVTETVPYVPVRDKWVATLTVFAPPGAFNADLLKVVCKNQLLIGVIEQVEIDNIGCFPAYPTPEANLTTDMAFTEFYVYKVVWNDNDKTLSCSNATEAREEVRAALAANPNCKVQALHKAVRQYADGSEWNGPFWPFPVSLSNG